MSSSFFQDLRINGIKEEVNQFKVFTFDESQPISYKAGQYLTLVHLLNGQEIRRSYSIASAPQIDAAMSIGVKRIPNGFYSRLLVDNTKVGDHLLTSGTGGLFVLPADIEKYKQVFFFAAGSGITPIYSLIKYALHFHPWLKQFLVYSSHSPSSTIFLEELRALQQEFNQQLLIEWMFSTSPNLAGARLYRELLINLVQRFSVADFPETLFYICGPHSYMRMCTFVLLEMNVPPDNIKRENFLFAQPKPLQVLPPDKTSHYAQVTLQGTQYKVLVQYPDSILQAAKKAGLSLPYSCETGRCANCIAKRLRGSVWLSHNEVLTETDLEMGLTLTCVGHPQNGDVELLIE